MSDVREQLERMATRGEVRGVDAIVAGALEEAEARANVTPPRPPARRWRVALAVGAAAVVLLAVVVVARRDGSNSIGIAGSPSSSSLSSSSQNATFPVSDARGWIFRHGEVRDVRDDLRVATFPFEKAAWPPVRVAGGFVAVGDDGNLWMAHDDGSAAAQLDSSVSGAAASSDGTKLAYSKVFDQGTRAQLFLVDIATGKERAPASSGKSARVGGNSDPGFFRGPGGGGGAPAPLGTPADDAGVVLLDGFGGVGGVGPG